MSTTPIDNHVQYRKVGYACNTAEYTTQKKKKPVVVTQHHSEDTEFIHSLIEVTHADTKMQYHSMKMSGFS